jgi:hypothetical protein
VRGGRRASPSQRWLRRPTLREPWSAPGAFGQALRGRFHSAVRLSGAAESSSALRRLARRGRSTWNAEVRTFHVERALDALGFAERRSRTDHAAGGSSSWVPRISRRSTWNGPSIGFGGVRLVSAPTDRQRSEATVRRRRHPQAAFWHAPAGEAVVPRRPQLDAATATRTRIRIGLSTAVGRACSSADRHQPPVEPPWSRQPAPRSSPRRQHPRPWCTKSALRAAAGPVRMLTSR